MRATGALSQPPQLAVHPRAKSTLTRIAQWTLYIAGALAIVLGVSVWPGHVHALGNVHGLAGWLVIASLWTLAATGARAGVARSTVWLAVGWGVVTAAGASAQYELPAGGWITVLHVATGVGAIAWGQLLLTRMSHAAAAAPARELAQTGEVDIKAAAAEFLAKKRIAVTGVSRNPEAQHGANIVYRRLRERGYDVFAINPNTAEVEGDRAYPDLKSIPNGVDAVVIGTRADRALGAMRECAELGIRNIWMHRSIGSGSVSAEATAWGRERGMRVIDGGCPLMFDPVSDTGHKVMRSLFTLTGKVPRRV
jgi:predicted CoA-binding protein